MFKAQGILVLNRLFPIPLLQGSRFITSLSTAAVAEVLSHKTPAYAGILILFFFPLQFNLPYFIEESQSADLLLLSRPCTF
jgi:Zn-dependent protease